MRELFRMWKYTNMVVLVALSAAMYAALIIPFQSIPLIPGHTSLRVANVLPVALGLLFGPAGAWGSGIGNLIGDMFGTLSPGAVGGFVANFLAAYLPYKLWNAMSPRGNAEPRIRGFRPFVRYESAVLIMSCAFVVVQTFWVTLLLGLAPPEINFAVVFPNTAIPPVFLTPVLIAVIYSRIKKWGLLWTDIMEPEDVSSGRFRKAGLALTIIGSVGGALVMAYFLYLSDLPIDSPLVVFHPLAFIALVFIGAALMGGREQVIASREAAAQAAAERSKERGSRVANDDISGAKDSW